MPRRKRSGCVARVTTALKTPVAGGEYLCGITPFRQMMDAHSVDIVMIDLLRPRTDKGELVPPGKPGLGLIFDEKVIARFKA